MADPPATTFHIIAGAGDAAGHIPIPFDPRALFGQARPPVSVVVNGYSYRSTIAIMSGETFVPFRASHREAAGVLAGDAVEVTLTLDAAPRTVDLPADAATAIDAAGLRPAWDRLSVSHRREHVESVESAKRPETRSRRIASILDRLRG